ncbi:STAS domain-containing protein [Streptomyces puniciscabiei]
MTTCDALGLGALFGAHLRAARYGGRLRLVCPEGPLLHVLDVTGLRRVVPVYPAVAEALLSSLTPTARSPGRRPGPAGLRPRGHRGRAAAGLLADGLPDSARRHPADRQAWIGRVLLRDRAGRTTEAELRACPLLNGKGEVQWLLRASVPKESDGAVLALRRSLLHATAAPGKDASGHPPVPAA